MKVLRDARQEALVSELEEFAQGQSSGSPAGKLDSDISKMKELASSTLSAFSRSTYEPGHFTASAFILSPERSKLLLIRHSKLNMWLQPGGHVESTDRDHVAAAIREAREEVGLTEMTLVSRLFDLDVHEIPTWGDSPAHLHHDLRVGFVAPSEAVTAGDDALDARWFGLDEIVSSAGVLADGLTTDESVRAAAQRLLALFK